MNISKKTISIFGTSKATLDSAAYREAYEIGEKLALAGFTIANGGYGGTMEAAAKGAAQAGGEVIGVTCTAFKRGKANQYVTKEIQTDSLPQRLNTLIELGDAYAVLTGGTGTLLELAEVWEMKNKRFPAAQKPIIILGKFWKPLVKLMADQDPECVGCLEFAENAEDAAEAIKAKLFAR